MMRRVMGSALGLNIERWRGSGFGTNVRPPWRGAYRGVGARKLREMRFVPRRDGLRGTGAVRQLAVAAQPEIPLQFAISPRRSH